MGARPIFNLETPSTDRVERLFRASGWCLGADGKPPTKLTALIDGAPAAEMIRAQRPDVGSARPDLPFGAMAGFVGDVLLDKSFVSKQFVLSFLLEHAGRVHIVGERQLECIPGESFEAESHSKNFGVSKVVETPPGAERTDLLGAIYYKSQGSSPQIRLLENFTHTHPYPPRTLKLIGGLPPNGIGLDLGCGVRPKSQIFPNVILLDAVRFKDVEVVSACARLPFKDNSLDLVVSHSVFEHLPDPRAMALEVFRILKPGGTVFIDTAFMQPYHGDPSHYFNMTAQGALKVFEGFDIVDQPMEAYQHPHFGLKMQLSAIAPFVGANSRWHSILSEFKSNLENYGRELDEDLGPVGRQLIAASVSILARKPGA